MRKHIAALACAGLVFGACGNVTTREERLAARGISANETAGPDSNAGAEALSPEGPSPAPDGAPSGDSTAAESTAVAQSAGAPSAAKGNSVPNQASAGGSAPSPAASTAAAAKAAPAPGSAAGGQSSGAGATAAAQTGPAGGPTTPKQQTAVKRSEIVFGSFGVEAGPLGTISGPAAPAIRAWVADVNSRGGLAGHPVRVILADDGGDPARAQAVVRQMVERDKVVAFLYPYAIGTLVPVLPYLEEKGIPVLGQMGAETLADYSAAVFQPFMAADKGTAWGFMLSLAAQTDKKKIGILWCREVAACSLVKDGIRKLSGYKGLEVVYDAQISFAQPDYTAEVLRAQQAGVEILMTFADIATVNRVAQSSHRQNYHPIQSATHNMQHTDALNYAGELDGLLTYSRIPPFNSPKMAPYLKAMRTYQPKAPIGELGGAAYVMGQLLEARIAPLLDDDPSPAEITEAMYSLKNETLDGLLPGVTFPRQKDRSQVNLCVIPVTFKDKRFLTPAGETFTCAPGWKPAG
ncbi:MAG: ABC transporter substrate-binding protein [Actinomycetota bacterium]|jgi:branched-chain amino acid transport system substrate-binding protein